MGHHRACRSSCGQTHWVAKHAAIIHLDHNTAAITAHCTSLEAALYWAARLVRQAMTAQLLAAGAGYAHAAAFSHRGHGVLITGHKGASKTTTLVTSLRLLGGDYVTNDRLLLRREDGELIGHPWPTHMRVGIGTLLAVPDLVDLVPADLRDLPCAISRFLAVTLRANQYKTSIYRAEIARIMVAVDQARLTAAALNGIAAEPSLNGSRGPGNSAISMSCSPPRTSRSPEPYSPIWQSLPGHDQPLPVLAAPDALLHCLARLDRTAPTPPETGAPRWALCADALRLIRTCEDLLSAHQHPAPLVPATAADWAR